MTTSKPQASKRQMEEWIQGYSFLAPALLVIFVFFILSTLFAVYLTFHDVNLIAHTYEWNDFRNFSNLLTDKQSDSGPAKYSLLCLDCGSCTNSYRSDYGLCLGQSGIVEASNNYLAEATQKLIEAAVIIGKLNTFDFIGKRIITQLDFQKIGVLGVVALYYPL